jgi:hypothetical protein
MSLSSTLSAPSRLRGSVVRISRVILLVAVLGDAAALYATTRYADIPLNCWNSSTCAAAGQSYTFAEFSATAPWSTSCSFVDPLSDDDTLMGIYVSFTGGNCDTNGADPPLQVDVLLNGYLLGTTTLHVNTCSCGGGDFGHVGGFAINEGYLQGAPGAVPRNAYNFGQTNVITFAGHGGGASTVRITRGTVNLSYEAAARIDFDVTNNLPETDRRMILSNLHGGYAYPRLQALGNGLVPMTATVTDVATGTPSAETGIYLRLADPPDTAAYMNLPPAPLAHAGDNPDGVTNAQVVTPGIPYTDSNGKTRLSIKPLPGALAGDNYEVEASVDPTFPANKTWKSGTLTAWKRIFVEKEKMLKNGMRLVADVGQGGTEIHVVDRHYGGNQGNRRISPGDHIVLVHSPALDRNDALAGSYMEFHHVAEVHRLSASDWRILLGTKVQGHVIPESIQHAEYRTEPQDDLVGDAIAYTTVDGALSPTDYFDTADSLLASYDSSGVPQSAFPQAFAEYYVLSYGVDAPPFVPVSYVLTSNPPTMQHLANRWSSNVDYRQINQANHQLLVLGDAQAPAGTTAFTTNMAAGRTTNTIAHQTCSILYFGEMAYALANDPSYGTTNLPEWAEKTEAHELAHQWKVDTHWAPLNNATDGHCPPDSRTFDAASTFCLEASPSNARNGQAGNMQARFHLVPWTGSGVPAFGFVAQGGAAWDSEYFTIRWRPDPYFPPFP